MTGYGQSAHLFEIKTHVIQRELERTVAAHPQRSGSVQFHFPTAPFRVRPADFPDHTSPRDTIAENDNWTWCQDFISGSRNFYDDGKIIPDLVKGLEAIAEVIAEHGPFDGIIGFSSGASIAALVASLLETGRKRAFDEVVSKDQGMAYPDCFLNGCDSAGISKYLQPPMKFAVCYSGFSLGHEIYAPFYAPKIKTPILHVVGQWDTVVGEQQSLSLTAKCEGRPQLLYHPGSHFVPQQRQVVSEVVKFLMKAVEN
jgi:hypothetical protein